MIDIDLIEKLMRDSTPGEWDLEHDDLFVTGPVVDHDWDWIVICEKEDEENYPTNIRSNNKLIVALHNSCEAMIAEIRAGRLDTERMDYMERHLCRAGEVKGDAGQTIKLCRVWSIMGELETLRETVDAFKTANDTLTK